MGFNHIVNGTTMQYIGQLLLQGKTLILVPARELNPATAANALLAAFHALRYEPEAWEQTEAGLLTHVSVET